ncbi:hypothetical protein EVAR_16335_1 [Eumeta japonica]|uniref:Uncharacterized protein n=1 Tax=Eumeta variegata TaxID=151549 RepID=A0A4C1VFQ4_EUMVA|nr:hypothetical protein EVAR_16335_1 [Eumeta japonica]
MTASPNAAGERAGMPTAHDLPYGRFFKGVTSPLRHQQGLDPSSHVGAGAPWAGGRPPSVIVAGAGAAARKIVHRGVSRLKKI